MADGLSFKIGAEVSGAIQGMTAVEQRALVLAARIEKLQKVAGSTQSFDKLTQSMNLLKKSQAELASLKTGNVFQGVTKGSSEATASMVNLSRVVQDAPYGFIGIANNLNPLLESFQRLKASTGTTGGALKALGSSLTGAGGIGLALGLVTTAITFATSGFGAWTRGLFGAKKGADDLSISIANLAQQADDARADFKSFEDQVKFLERLGSVTVDFNFEQGFERDILKLRQKSVNLDTEIFDGEKTLGELKRIYEESWKVYESEGGKALKKLTTDFQVPRLIPDAAIEKLSDSDKEIARAYKKSAQDIYDFQIALDKKREDRTIARANIRVALAEEERRRQKEILEKQKDDYEKYVSATISRGKELAAFFEGRRIVPNFTIFDTKGEQLKKALQVIKDFNAGALGIKFRPLIPIEPQFKIENGYVEKEIQKRFKDLRETGTSQAVTGPVISISPKVAEANKKIFDDLTKRMEDIKRASEGVARSISEAFGQAFEGIAEGRNAFQVLGQAIKQVVVDLIKAAIQAFVFRAIISLVNPAGALAPGLAKLASGFNFGGFRAGGGPVGSGKAYVVGENGPEIFTPSVNGSIIPNNRAAAFSGGGFNSSFPVRDRQYIRGNNLVLVTARTNRSQSRLG